MNIGDTLLAPEADSPEYRARMAQVCEWLDQGLVTLTDKQHDLLLLRMGGMSLSEAGTALGVSKVAAHKMEQRILAALRKPFSDRQISTIHQLFD